MIKLTTKQNNYVVSVNPNLVTYVMDSTLGCVIHFMSGESLHVIDAFNTVTERLNESK